MPTQSGMEEREAGLLVLSQLLFTLLGSMVNIFLGITLRDLPNLPASTYHVLLANLAAANLLTCTLAKPIASVFISYAFLKVRKII